MSSTSMNNKLVWGSVLAASCAILCLAIAAHAQYNTYDSDSNSDSEGGPILSNSDLGKLVRNSARSNSGRNSNLRNYNQQQQLAATRNLYNKQQPLQYAPTQSNRRQFNGAGELSGYSPLGTAASNGQSNNDEDDNEGGNFGPNFGANFDGNDNDGEGAAGAQADGQPLNLNQAASGYPGQGDYIEGFNFGGAAGYGPAAGEAGADFGMGEGYAGEGRRAKSASSLMGARGNIGDEDAGAPQFGPNSAVNSGDVDEDGRSGYAPEGNEDNDDE